MFSTDFQRYLKIMLKTQRERSIINDIWGSMSIMILKRFVKRRQNDMKYFRIAISALCILSICLYAIFFIKEKSQDKTYPVITIDEEIIDVSIKVTDEELLKGVTAYDAKDGDISSKIMIESISKFVEHGVSIVTYSVCDNDNHATSATRKIRYTDYTEPVFVIEESLVFPLGQKVNIQSCVGAWDCIDGDISDRVIITATDYNTNEVGAFNVSLMATNSKGDTIYMEVPVYIKDVSFSAPKIDLSDHLVYSKVGQEVDLVSYVRSAVDKYEQPVNVLIDTNLDINKPGTYEAHYETQDTDGRRGYAIMTIIVEE